MFWCGTQLDLDRAEKAQVQADAMVAAAKDNKETPMFPSMYQRQGNVGVVTISGTLIPGQAGFMRFFGATGYDDVRQALLDGVNDKGAKSIMLNIDSTGGAVNGVSDTSKFIKSINAIKPVTAYADTMASAAYWLGSAAQHITAADTGIIGSIGVLRVHTEYSKMDAKEGITRTVLRAGEYKALMNSIEPLSKPAIEQTTAMLEDVYNIFVSDVADNLGTTAAIVDKQMAQGREFLGKRAVEAGLVHKTGTYEDALAYANSLGSANRTASATSGVAKAGALDNNPIQSNKGTDVKPTLTEEQTLAAVAAGVDLASASEGSPVVDNAAGDSQQASGATDSVTAEVDVAAIQAELTTAQAELATTKAQLTEAQATITAREQAAIEADNLTKEFVAIVSASTKLMLVALNSDTSVLAGLDAKALLAKHKEVSSTFKSKFKAGGAAATSAAVEDAPKPKATVNPVFAYAVQNAVTR